MDIVKKFIIGLALFMSFGPYASSYQSWEKNKLYYTALNTFIEEKYGTQISVDDLKKFEELLFYTGIEVLEDYDDSVLLQFPTSSTQFILGRKKYLSGKLQEAATLLIKIHKKHRYHPEAWMMLQQIGSLQNNAQFEMKAYGQCLSSASSQESSSPAVKTKNYYRMVYENCIINHARYLYKIREYEKALVFYDKIPKTSYKWPYILLEKAWAYYQLGDYNRTLGLLITYKSPLLETYFFPEAEYLTALAYYNLCLWPDSVTVIKQYYSFYRPKYAALEKILSGQKSSKNYFFNLMFNPDTKNQPSGEFVNQIITRIKKQTRFSLDFNTVYKINKEIQTIKKYVKSPIKKNVIAHLELMKENMTTKINYYAKSEVFKFLDSVHFISNELYKVNLEIISTKKDLIYANKRLESNRSRGDLKHVNRSSDEHFWLFHGAFWADELGDYSFGLKSNCETVRIEPKAEEK